MLNVVDNTQKTSYTRKDMTNVSDFQVNIQEQGINFIGNPRKNNYIPGYLFKVSTPAEFANVKRALASCIFEAKNKILHTKAEDFDEDYLANQLVSDINDDVKMKEIDEQYDDFYFAP
jgi:hypothetical protein